jgi:saccharopine dehydrogenase (NAD+, L-lysine-forming)
MNRIGIRKEEKAYEARVPLMPDQVKLLRDRYHIDFLVEPNKQRALSDDEYSKVGAAVVPLKGNGAQVVFGIKEMPIGFFERDVVYVFFSHTIKGQKYNMPMLQNILDAGATLIDYERVVDEKGRRLIFFGNWAGMAGISETFHVLGERLEVDRVSPNPFAGMKSTLQLKNLDAVKEEFKLLGERITKQGLPKELIPFVVGFAGYGNVSRGAQEIFDILPHEVVQPEDLPNLKPKENVLYKCVFKEEYMVKPNDLSGEFDLQDYYRTGKSKYTGVFHNYVQYLTVLMNCIYWTEKYPRLISKNFIKRHWKEKNRRLRVIGDISCDIGGAIEFTTKCTTCHVSYHRSHQDRSEKHCWNLFQHLHSQTSQSPLLMSLISQGRSRMLSLYTEENSPRITIISRNTYRRRKPNEESTLSWRGPCGWSLYSLSQ